jgi:CRP-like cAMP-binding protein
VDLPRKLCDVAMKAMARDPADRYQTVQELKADLERFIQSGWQFETRELAPDTVIIREGDRGDTAYIIVRGRCRVTRQVEGKQVTLAELGPGELFGETAVFADQPRSSTVTAIGPVTLRVVPRQHFDELWEGTALGRFVQALARRFNDSSQQASELESDLEVWMMFARIFKFLALSGETAADGRREARWSALREILMAQLNRPEDWILEVIQTDPMVQVDIGRDVISVGTIF